LKVSVKTIETHRDRIKKKLGLADGTELLHRAVLWASKEVVNDRDHSRPVSRHAFRRIKTMVLASVK
jgi:hypothetical protein